MLTERPWLAIETAPKDNTLIQGKEEDLSIPHLRLYRCAWKNGAWRLVPFGTVVHPTMWRLDIPRGGA